MIIDNVTARMSLALFLVNEARGFSNKLIILSYLFKNLCGRAVAITMRGDIFVELKDLKTTEFSPT